MLLCGEADKAHLEAGGHAAGGAAREKAIGGAPSARAGVRDICRSESGALELIADDGAQIDEGLAGAPCPRVIPRAINFATETIAEIGINFEATLAYRWTHGSANVGGASTKMKHRADARIGDLRDDAAPSGMQRAGYFAFRIDQQYRHAICGKYSKHDAGLSGDDTVARRAKRRSVASRGMNDVAVHLVQPRDDFQLGHLATEALPVGIDGAFVVADPVRKIHRGECASADTARAADESVADRGVGPRAKDLDLAGVR
jgi:hypothetical protein